MTSAYSHIVNIDFDALDDLSIPPSLAYDELVV